MIKVEQDEGRVTKEVQQPFAQILGIGTVNPAHKVEQGYVRELVGAMFDRLPGIERLMGVFENTGIETRYLGAPLDWFKHDHSFEEKNALWFEIALELSLEASRKAIAQAGIETSQIAGVVLVTTTGIATPSLESYLIQRLGIPLSAVRLPLWGLGCAGGAAGLARAAELAQNRPGQYVLMVAVELCSLTFIRNDLSKSNLIATSLFADGAAAVVLGSPKREEGRGNREVKSNVPGRGAPRVVGGFTRLLPSSYDVMGWDVSQRGLKVRFSQSIPSLVQGELGNLIREGLDSYGLTIADIGTWVLHPGGAKVLTAYRQGMGIDEQSYQASWSVLRRFGNMSSPTVLFVLEELMGKVEAGSMGILLALGPGFAAEGVLLEW